MANPNNDKVGKVLNQDILSSNSVSTVETCKFAAASPLNYCESPRILKRVQQLMYEAIHMKNTDMPDKTLGLLRQEYLKLDWEGRSRALLVLSTEFGIDNARVVNLMRHYLSLQPDDSKREIQKLEDSERGVLAARYRTEHDLRSALVPLSSRLFEHMNGQVGGLKFLVDLRADLISVIKQQNLASLRALDANLKGMFSTWLGPACLELHQITWEDSASLLEKIVGYEAVHPISNLYDLKRRLGVGRRCYGYFHPAMPGEPLVFIEVALTKDMGASIQEVLFDEVPLPESEATAALFYSISSTQPGLKGIDLGNFLIKRVARLLQQEMSQLQVFTTLSPIPGFLKWLIPKLVSACKSSNVNPSGNSVDDTAASNVFKEELLHKSEERAILEVFGGDNKDANPLEILLRLLTSDQEWVKTEKLADTVRPCLMRLCARYLLREKKRGKALDPVTNFHVRNGAIVERLNWMGNRSTKGLQESAGIMVNYLYRLEKVEEINQAYLNQGEIRASPAVEEYLQPNYRACI
ncbi:hypothetical protein O6H91_21G048500 [Diphasiastrum complanatum]|uniref:Uncharacterized protein n=1 Tax=Diphasiastrum complanatum TaxID=34168 RepID=A0ACC2AK85_DIPCM|nr:hypothetical protein O6H91_21G048500 [Diphasiastrum complanatum]